MGVIVNSSADGRSKKRPGVDEQRVIIMAAAVTLFADQGVRPVSIAQICAAAEVSRPTFYRCFKDKDALVSLIYDDAVNTHVERFFSNGPAPGSKGMKASLDDLLDAIFEHSQLAQLIFLESSDPDSPAARIIDDAFEHAADVMSGKSSGKQRHKPSRVYLKSLMAAIQWIVQDAIRKNLTAAAKQDAKAAAYALVVKALS